MQVGSVMIRNDVCATPAKVSTGRYEQYIGAVKGMTFLWFRYSGWIMIVVVPMKRCMLREATTNRPEHRTMLSLGPGFLSYVDALQ